MVHFLQDSSDVLDAFSWSDEHLQMPSTIARQGFCFYAKELANAGLKMGLESKVDFTREMLSTASMMEFGNLVRRNLSSKSSHSGMSTEMSLPENGTLSNRYRAQLNSTHAHTVRSFADWLEYFHI